MTDGTAAGIVALTVLSGSLMTGGKLRLHLAYVYRLDNHRQYEKCQQQPRYKRMSCFPVLPGHLQNPFYFLAKIFIIFPQSK